MLVVIISIVLYFTKSCLSDFHPLYQAMLGDPTLRVHTLTYNSSDTSKRNLSSLLVYPNMPGPFHGIIVAPDIGGRDSFEDGKAISLARLGYAAMAADMLYEGLDTRQALLEQYLAAYRQLKQLPFIGKISSIGYGLGGLTVLDAVRQNVANISAAVCIHAILRQSNQNESESQQGSKTKLLIMNGWLDPLNTADTVVQVMQELDELKVDWQLHQFGRAKHAFSLPVGDLDNITQYDPDLAQQAWLQALMFLESSLRE